MKKFVAFWIVVISVTAVVTKWDHIVQPLTAQTPSPVSVQLVSPAAGSTVSNTITLTANASSTAGRISMVVFYCDGQPIATNFATPFSPKGFGIAQKP